jgi:hypothetical protein
VSLTDLEKQAGRLFVASRQAALDEINRAEVPVIDALPVWEVVRHDCPLSGGASIGIQLRERYETCPRYKACYCGKVGVDTAPEGDFPHWDCGNNVVALAAGTLVFVWKEGRCACGAVARSLRGMHAEAADWPPRQGRPSGGEASTHPGDTRLAGA